MDYYNVSYSRLKNLGNNRSLTFNYITESNFWTLFLVDVPKESVYFCTLANDGSDSANATDFENNIQPTATQWQDIDDGVANTVAKTTGRTYITLTATAVATVASEALISFVANSGGTNAAAATSYTVTSGKTFRIQAIHITVTNTSSGVVQAFRLRSSATVTASSPILWAGRTEAATPGGLLSSNTPATGNLNPDIPDGLEIAGGQQVGISQVGATGATFDLTLIGYEY